MKIKCGSCGTAQEFVPSGDITEFTCSECGNSITVASVNAETIVSGEMETPEAGVRDDSPPVTSVPSDPILTAQTALSAKSDIFKPGERFSGYIIERKIGRGGMGVVYKATQVSLNRPVALKILKKELCNVADYEERFIREARSAGSLNHPNILQIYDVSVSNDIYFFSMEYIEGESLADILEKRGKLSVEQAITVITAVSRALKEASDKGIIHRDIKPDNIMLTKSGKVKVADFGLARVADSDEPALTKPGMTLGTPNYMAPEQINAEKDIDIRSDIYSLGCTFYHLITGKPPFKGKNTFELLEHHMYDTIEFPDNEPISEAVKAVILKMTCKKREERFASMDAVLHALGNLKKSMPALDAVSAEKPVLKKIIPYAAAGLAVLVLVLLMFLIGDDSEETGQTEKGNNEPPAPDTEVVTEQDQSGSAFHNLKSPYLLTIREPGRLYSIITEDIVKLLPNKDRLAAAVWMKFWIAKGLNVDLKVLSEVIAGMGAWNFFSVQGKPVGFIDMTTVGLNAMFSGGNRELIMNEFRGRTFFRKPDSNEVHMRGDGYVAIAGNESDAYGLISKEIHDTIPEDKVSLPGYTTLASGLLKGGVFEYALKELSIIKPSMIQKGEIILAENSDGITGRISLQYKPGEVPEQTKNQIPDAEFRKTRLPVGAEFYGIMFLPDEPVLDVLFKKEPGEKKSVLYSRMFRDIFKSFRSGGVTHCSFGFYKDEKSQSLLIQVNPLKSGVLRMQLERLGYSFESVKRPGAERRGGERRKIFSGVDMAVLTDDHRNQLHVLVLPGRMYISTSGEILRELFTDRRPGGAMLEGYPWNTPPPKGTESCFYGISGKLKGAFIRLFLKGDTLNAGVFIDLAGLTTR